MALEVNVQHGDLDGSAIAGRFHRRRHALCGPLGVDGEAPVDQVRLERRLAVRLEDVDSRQGVLVAYLLLLGGSCGVRGGSCGGGCCCCRFCCACACTCVTLGVGCCRGRSRSRSLTATRDRTGTRTPSSCSCTGQIGGRRPHPDALDGVDGEAGEEVALLPDDLAGHGRLGGLDEVVVAELIDAHDHIPLEVRDGRLEGRPVSGDDGGGVDAVLDEVVAAAEQLGRHDDDRGGAVPDLVVLELGQIDQDAGGRMLHLELAQDGGAVVGDEDVADVVDEHLVEADGSQGGLDDVGHGEGGRHVADADVLAGLALPIEELHVCNDGCGHGI